MRRSGGAKSHQGHDGEHDGINGGYPGFPAELAESFDRVLAPTACAIHAAASKQSHIGGINDGVHRFVSYISFDKANRADQAFQRGGIMGLDLEQQRVLAELIAGDEQGIKKVTEALAARGAKKVVPLRISAPFHFPAMGKIGEDLRSYMQTLRFREPVVPIVAMRITSRSRRGSTSA